MFEFDSSKEYLKTTKSRSVIRFQDCDPLKHLNNAKYFDYYYNAREDQVPKLYGVQLSAIFRAFDAVWVVYNHQIAYIRPAQMGEWVNLYSRIIWHNHNSVLVEYFMTNDEDNQLKNVMWTKLKYVSNAGNSIEHPKKITEYLDSVTFPGVDLEIVDFQKRIKEIKKEMLTGNLGEV